MRRVVWVLVAALMGAAPAWAATRTFHEGATTNATGANVSTADKGSLGIAVTISGTATVTFQGSADGGLTWNSINCVALGATANVTTATATGQYQCAVGGLTHVQAPISGCSGCTVTVRVNTSMASRSGGGTGSGLPAGGVDGECLMKVAGVADWDPCPSGASGSSWTVQALTATATLAGTHKFVTCDATLGAVAITLPAASATSGADFQIKKIDSSANACTITRAGTDTIDGATTAVLTVQYEALGVAADGTSAWTLF